MEDNVTLADALTKAAALNERMAADKREFAGLRELAKYLVKAGMASPKQIKLVDTTFPKVGGRPPKDA